MKFDVKSLPLVGGAKILEEKDGFTTLLLPASGGGLSITPFIGSRERYLVFDLEVLEEHSAAFNLFVWPKDAAPGDEATFRQRFGMMPRVCGRVVFDTEWLNGETLFGERNPGQLKVVCHGSRVSREEVGRMELTNFESFHDMRVRISGFELTDRKPTEFPLPDVKLIDALGQYKRKDWAGKTQSLAELSGILHKELESDAVYPKGWTKWGGFADRKLTEGTGFFGRVKADGRWWLTDPDGYAFFSVGPDCVRPGGDSRVDPVASLCDWLPDREGEFASAYTVDAKRGWVDFSFVQANLMRVFGENWKAKWMELLRRHLMNNGMNTLANWSDPEALQKMRMPYVTSLPAFPATEKMIFRDFPDVFSPEFAKNAERCALALSARADDPFMIGYFLRNEPAWAFVDGLVLAEEVLHNPLRTFCKQALLDELRQQYGTIAALNAAWRTAFPDFSALEKPINKAASLSHDAEADLRRFSRKMVEAYVSVPSAACRKVDGNHMILGMRWAWISDPDLVCGWENFDVFSINCYAVDPTPSIQNVVDLGVDLPVMIGEFHFGSLEGGLTATGLEGTLTQKDRAIAYRCYLEHAAAHPYGVGCHYFQLYDQFALGRFDGENYNIGLLDVCSRPYTAMMEASLATAKRLLPVLEGRCAPYNEPPHMIPMIAY
ncbi:MAG: beta-galactosidase [Christensenellales bacterium]|jgi:hypothetical protein